MKYLVLTYEKPRCVSPAKHTDKVCSILKKNKLYKKYKLYQQYRQLSITSSQKPCGNATLLTVTLHAHLSDLQKFSFEKLQSRIQSYLQEAGCAEDSSDVRLLQVENGLECYVPEQIALCTEPEELFLALLQKQLERLCQKGSWDKNRLSVLFLEDGSCDSACLIRALSQDVCYVSVYSERHEELEEVYQELYEQEGLMVQACSSRTCRTCGAQLVFDLMRSWRGAHHLYPKDSLVFSLYSSHEKEEYLRAKQTDVRKYVAVLRSL